MEVERGFRAAMRAFTFRHYCSMLSLALCVPRKRKPSYGCDLGVNVNALACVGTTISTRELFAW